MPVYLDHNATSPALPEHLASVFARLQSLQGNPSSPHAAGRAASVALTESRRQVASSLDVEPSEVVFVSGGSEANNIATTGVLGTNAKPLSELHAITSAIEHPSILEPLIFLRDQHGLQLTILSVGTDGKIACSELMSAVRPNTVLISVMVANNETGAVQPTFQFAEWLNAARWIKLKGGQEWRASQEVSWPAWAQLLRQDITQETLQSLHFHVDAVQAYGKLPPASWWSAGYDSAGICGHKLGGLAGIGALIVRRGRKFQPLVRGGSQERARRAGTENLAGVLSLGLVAKNLQGIGWWERIQDLDERRIRLRERIASLPDVVMNTPAEGALPNTINFSVDGMRRRGEDVLLELDLRGFYASSGSACSSGANRASHVILAQQDDVLRAKNAVRLSLSPATSQLEIDQLLTALAEILSTR